MPRKKKSRPGSAHAARSGPIRLQRLLANAGFGSRRQCEELIQTGRVHVDADICTRLGTTVDLERQKVTVDGQPLRQQKLVYFAVHKPVGVVTTNRDPQGRARVVDLVPPAERVFPVGRLDRSSEGLILLTNDGELAQRLTHPKFGIRKIYRVTVAGRVESETMKKMRLGIHIAEGFVKVEGAKLISAKSKATEIEIILREGKNREIRRILARLGHKVQKLRRIAVGSLRLGDMPTGAYRPLLREEVDKLWAAVDAAQQAAAVESDPPTRPGGGRKSKSAAAKLAKTSGRRPTSVRGAKAKRPSRKKSVDTRKKAHHPAAVVLPETSVAAGGVIIGGDEPSPDRQGEAQPKRGKSKSGRPKSGRPKSGRPKPGRPAKSKQGGPASRKAAGTSSRTGGKYASSKRTTGKKRRR